MRARSTAGPPARPDAWRACVDTPLRALATLLILFVLARGLGWLWRWGVHDAVFRADPVACRALAYHGACWGVIAEKWPLILWGRYPPAEQWRAALASALMLAGVVGLAWPANWRPWRLLAMAVGVAVAALALMRGGWAGLPVVPTRLWGGLPLTLGLPLVGLGLGFPLGLGLALGRLHGVLPVRALCTAWIETLRAVPLIGVLFMSSFLIPLLLPSDWRPDILLRTWLGMTAFVAAYLAEVIRGGLQAIPPGQLDAARALGLGPAQVMRHVVLPQALRKVAPGLTNTAIGSLKDGSLVTVVGLFELTGALSLALGGDPEWRPFYLEGYIFIGAVYALLCLALSRYGLWLERRLGVARS